MNAPDVLMYGQLTLLAGLDGLPDEDWETAGVCGVWSVRQIIAHLASYEAAIADILQSFVDPAAPTPTLDRMKADPAGFNDDEVAVRAPLSCMDTLAELTREHERVLDLAGKIAPETYREPGTLPWYGWSTPWTTCSFTWPTATSASTSPRSASSATASLPGRPGSPVTWRGRKVYGRANPRPVRSSPIADG